MKRTNLVALSSISIVMLGFISFLTSTNEGHGSAIASAEEYEQPVKHDVATADKNRFLEALLDDNFLTDNSADAGTDRQFSYLSLIVANHELFATSSLPEKLSAFFLDQSKSGIVDSFSGNLIMNSHLLGDLEPLLETLPLQLDFSL